MCLILFSFNEYADTPLIVAANRDEFFARPSTPAHYWQKAPQVLAGMDEVAGGTWLGVTRCGRFAAITNVREPHIQVDNPLSRGDLTRRFLTGNQSPEDYLRTIEQEQTRYSGFNLLVGELSEQTRELWYFSNRKEGIHPLGAGTYGLSNHLLDSPWPKVNAGKAFLRDALLKKQRHEDTHDTLRAFLENDALAKDNELPQTGIDYAKEKALSAAFIRLPNYGTRTSTVVSVNQHHNIIFSEKNYLASDNTQQPSDKAYTRFTISAS